MILARGEPSNRSFLRQGRITPATVEPRKVTAMTRVASRARVWKSKML